jgi:hypothetical protein
LIEEPFVSTNLDPKEYGKVFLKRTHPFRSSSSDVAQVTGRSNIDLQWTTRLPILSDAVESEDVPIDRAASSHLASFFDEKRCPHIPIKASTSVRSCGSFSGSALRRLLHNKVRVKKFANIFSFDATVS